MRRDPPDSLSLRLSNPRVPINRLFRIKAEPRFLWQFSSQSPAPKVVVDQKTGMPAAFARCLSAAGERAIGSAWTSSFSSLSNSIGFIHALLPANRIPKLPSRWQLLGQRVNYAPTQRRDVLVLADLNDAKRFERFEHIERLAAVH